MNINDEKRSLATPPTDMLKLLILQRRNDILEAIEHYYKRSFAKSNSPPYAVRSRIVSLYLEIEASLRRSEPTEYKKIENLVFSDKVDNSIKAFRMINKWLDDKHITRVDVREGYDSTRVEYENEAKSL